MFYAEDSLHYWRNLMWNIGVKEGQLRKYSMGEIMSRTVERSDNAAAHPLVKVYTKTRLRQLFEGFVDISIVQRQMEPSAVPRIAALRASRGTSGRSWAGISSSRPGSRNRDARSPRTTLAAAAG